MQNMRTHPFSERQLNEQKKQDLEERPMHSQMRIHSADIAQLATAGAHFHGF